MLSPSPATAPVPNAPDPAPDESTCEARLLEMSGRVQGVWFRASMQEAARRLGVSGWCRNTPEGSVEALVVGNISAVNAVMDWCEQGPPLARVDRVDVLDLGPDDPVLADVPHPFEVRR